MRVAADVGGTFTDILLQRPDGAVRVPQGALDPTRVRPRRRRRDTELLDRARATAAATAPLEEVVHGTTVATNAVLERRGGKTALVTTKGFRDVLELRRVRMPHLYDLFWTKPPPLVERSLRFEVDERMSAEGEVLSALDDDEVREIAARLRELAVESVAVCLLHAHRHPAARARGRRDPARRARRACPCRSRARSSASSRSTSARRPRVVNAYVRPLMEAYIDDIRAGLDVLGIDAPLTIMQSSGGVMTADAASARPVFALESGPAAGVVAALALAQGIGHRERDRLRHGRHDGEGVADRGRPHLAQPRVRGRRFALGRQPAASRKRRADPDPDDRHRRGRRGRGQHRLAGRVRAGCTSGRAARARSPGLRATDAAAPSRP